MQKKEKEWPSILVTFLKILVLLQGSVWSLLRDSVNSTLQWMSRSYCCSVSYLVMPWTKPEQERLPELWT